jgi:transcriptional regulator with XRE-family HTH domain
MAFADRLRLARTRAGLTRAELAEAAGISERAIEEYENGRVPRRALPALARALEVSTVWLLTGEQMIDKRLADQTAELAEMRAVLERLEQKIDELLKRPG